MPNAFHCNPGVGVGGFGVCYVLGSSLYTLPIFNRNHLTACEGDVLPRTTCAINKTGSLPVIPAAAWPNSTLHKQSLEAYLESATLLNANDVFQW